MSKNLFITEKPSVASQFSQALHENMRRGDGFFEGDSSVITWCVGHLVSMSYPEEYDPALKMWRYDTIPFIPDTYKYQVIDNVKKQFEIVKRLLTRDDISCIYICTDSGREGEYIYRLVDRMAQVPESKPRKRVWIDSQTEEEIARGIREAKDWTDRFDSMLLRYRQHPQADDNFIDKQWARLNFYRACILERLNERVEAQKAYQVALTTKYAKTSDGQIEATSYLMEAGRWNEAADKFTVLERQLQRYDMQMTLDNIRTFLIPKFMANASALRTDTALVTGKWICHALDSAIVKERQNNALELATLYDMQQKETEIIEQQASLSQQRFLSTAIILVLVIFGFGLFIYFRHQSSKRLKKAYHHLEMANARAEESSRMKSDFIQQISHEIRTPLNVLSGFTQIITSPDMEIDEEMQEDINRQIIENTNRITGLVNKMLELSDANSQKVIKRQDDVSAELIATDAIDASGIATAQHLQFDLQITEEAFNTTIHTNRRAATRALSLLLDNARKFTDPSEAHYHDNHDGEQKKATLRVYTDAEYLRFCIEDNGIGVPSDEAERIFNEFVQLDEYYNGTGIGLTVARSQARRLGGDIWLDPTYSGGARFIYILPLAKEDTDTEVETI